MKKNLIINLKRNGDLYQSAHLIQSLCQKNPSTEYQILVFEEFRSVARTIRGISKVHTISRKKLISFYKNDIYNDGLGINLLEKTLRPLLSSNWEQVINYSNDRASTYLTGLISSVSKAKPQGISFDSTQTIQYSSDWAIIYNDVLTSLKSSPASINDATHMSLALEHSESCEKVKTNPKHNELAFNNLNKLRESLSKKSNSDVKIVGFQLKASAQTKEIPEDKIIETIKYFSRDETLMPILLIAPIKEERELAERINQSFDTKLVSIEADFIALPSVVLNLDLVVTPDTFIKHLCDLVETPCLEVSLGPSPLFLQGTQNPQSYVLSRRARSRDFNFSHGSEFFTEEHQQINPNSIYTISQAILGRISINEIKLDSEWSLYNPQKDSIGLFLTNIAGAYDPEVELQRSFNRQFLHLFSGLEINESLFDSTFQSCDLKTSNSWITKQREEVALVSKSLLVTLRSLIQTQEDVRHANSFVKNLGQIIEVSQNDNMTSIPLILFRSKVESLTSKDLQQNFKKVESLLYELKDNIQLVTRTFRFYEEYTTQKETDRRVEQSKSIHQSGQTL